MAVTEIFNIKNEKVGEVELNEELFGVEVNPHIIHEIVLMQLANRRAGTASTKTRAEVSGSNKKPWRQKGTGRARSGTKRSPLWRGGGVAFGPKPRSYSYSMPKRVKKLGLRMAISTRFAEKQLLILNSFQMDEIKTKEFLKVMDSFQLKNALIIIPDDNENLFKSSRNAQGFKVMPAAGLNVYDVLLHEKLVLLEPCLEQLEKRLLA